MIDGVEVVDATPVSREEMKTVTAALDLIARADVRRFARLRRDLRRVILVTHGGPEYVHAIRGCVISANDVRQQSAERVAMTLVHEATHARLGALGFAHKWTLRDRIEKRCVEEEISFIQRVPGTDRLLKEARKALVTSWHSDSQLFERTILQLRSLGRPEWLLSLYRVLLEPEHDASTQRTATRKDGVGS
jgi:hypothetical protein